MEVYSQIVIMTTKLPTSARKNRFSPCNSELLKSVVVHLLCCFHVFLLSHSVRISDVIHGKFSFSSFIVTWTHTGVTELCTGAMQGFWEGGMRPICVFPAPAIAPTGTHCVLSLLQEDA